MRYPAFAAFALFFFCPAFGQLSTAVAITDSVAAESATATFLQLIRLQKEIYNGPEHITYLPTIEGFAYFASKNWQGGTVQYDGITYTGEQLLYDLVKDKLIIKRPDAFPVELRSDKVDWFNMPGHLFVHVDATSGLRQGFYEQLASGPVVLLAKRKKEYEERVDQVRLIQKFTEQTTYYAIRNGQAHAIKNLHALLGLMDKRGNPVQQQLRKQGIKYKRNHEAALIAAADFFNKTQP